MFMIFKLNFKPYRSPSRIYSPLVQAYMIIPRKLLQLPLSPIKTSKTDLPTFKPLSLPDYPSLKPTIPLPPFPTKNSESVTST